MTEARPLILASGSPRRRRFIRELGLIAEIRPSSFDERRLPHTDPRERAVAAARGKATDVAAGLPRGLVIGMDTLVHLEGRILGKPRDPADARRMLEMLSGRTHCVTTGVALIDVADGGTWEDSETSQVGFRSLGIDEIERYIAGGEPLDKAGSYGIQGGGAEFVEWLKGDYFNVSGFPVHALRAGLSRFLDIRGLRPLRPPARFRDSRSDSS